MFISLFTLTNTLIPNPNPPIPISLPHLSFLLSLSIFNTSSFLSAKTCTPTATSHHHSDRHRHRHFRLPPPLSTATCLHHNNHLSSSVVASLGCRFRPSQPPSTTGKIIERRRGKELFDTSYRPPRPPRHEKFRLGKQPHNKDYTIDHSFKDASAFETRRNTASSSRLLGSNVNNNNVDMTDAIKMQMEVQRRLQDQLEVQRHLQLRIEAQGKYMQNMIHRACQTLSEEPNVAASPSFRGNNNILGNNSPIQDHFRGSMQEFVPNFQHFHDPYMCNTDSPLDVLPSMGQPSFEEFMKAANSNDNFCQGKKRLNS